MRSTVFVVRVVSDLCCVLQQPSSYTYHDEPLQTSPRGRTHISTDRPKLCQGESNRSSHRTRNRHHHHHWAALVPIVGWRRPQHATSKLACLVLSSARSCHSSICPGRLSIISLVSLSYGRSSLRRLMCLKGETWCRQISSILNLWTASIFSCINSDYR